MKKIFNALLLGSLLLASTSCNKYLDINTNPNAATAATPELVLPNALTVTAANQVGFNQYGSQLVGYEVNAGGYGGFGTLFTYSFSNSSFTGLWTNTYDNLEDYQYIVTNTKGVSGYAQYEAIANIMKAYNFQLLVDQYGDIPYTNALQGANNTSPSYDNAATVYQALITSLDAAITQLKANPTGVKSLTTSDVLYHGDIPSWEKFANTLKLRMLIRIQNVSTLSSFVTTEFGNLDAAVGFITDDAMVNPGYVQTSGKQNPNWDATFQNAAGTLNPNGRAYIASKYVFAFYSGVKITDNTRGALVYRGFPGSTATGQLGDAINNPNAPTSYPDWYTGTGTGNTTGILKGISAGQPLMLAAESYFLQAEAALNGKITGDSYTLFKNGIIASFNYLEKGVANTASATATADFNTYVASNSATNYLVEYLKALDPNTNLTVDSSPTQKLEAIITQKYIALNFIAGAEAWSEFRRTGYPTVTTSGAITATGTFASLQTTSPRPDRLPVRILYPDTEYQLNPANVPASINVFTSRIFWDLN
jgi:hypothetical protein